MNANIIMPRVVLLYYISKQCFLNTNYGDFDPPSTKSVFQNCKAGFEKEK
jgi:hypothetical protein